MLFDRRRGLYVVSFENGERVGVRRFVRDGRPAGDDAGVVADDVADEEAVNGRRRCRCGELPALDGREMFPHGVDLVDRRPARKQVVGQGLQLREADPIDGSRQQGAATSRDQTQHERPRTGVVGEREHAPRARLAGLVRRRVRAFDDPDVTRLLWVVRDDDAVGEPLAQHVLDDGRHLRGSLPAADDNDFVIPVEVDGRIADRQLPPIEFERLVHHARRLCRLDARLDAVEGGLVSACLREFLPVSYHRQSPSNPCAIRSILPSCRPRRWLASARNPRDTPRSRPHAE